MPFNVWQFAAVSCVRYCSFMCRASAELTALGLYRREVGLVWEEAGELMLDEAIV